MTQNFKQKINILKDVDIPKLASCFSAPKGCLIGSVSHFLQDLNDVDTDTTTPIKINLKI